jgi:hypothetical protein
MRLSGPVLSFTMDNMPNLEAVVLMGADAEVGFRSGGGDAYARDRSLHIFRVSHPSKALTDVERFDEWAHIFSGPSQPHLGSPGGSI